MGIAGFFALTVSSALAVAVIVSVIEDEELRRKLVARGTKRALDFSWETAAAETLEFYERVVQGL